MLISVCIPIHNYDVVPLAKSIVEEIKGSNIEAELICIDDGSSNEWLDCNKALNDFCTYEILGENIGRAQVRNRFLKHTKGDYLLYLDDDSMITKGFLSKYAEVAKDRNYDVVVGGRIYAARFNDRQHHLRYLYGTRVECRNAEARAKDPYRSFMTNNFMVQRNVLETIPFDERLKEYGHEDTLFGYELKKARKKICHIDNPVTNGDVESNEEFLRKSEIAVGTLSDIYDYMNGDEGFCETVRLLHTYNNVRKIGMLPLLLAAFRMSRKCLEGKFIRGRGFCLPEFSFYKLGILIEKRYNK